jgi:hypothetical protein
MTPAVALLDGGEGQGSSGTDPAPVLPDGRFVADGDSSAVVRHAISALPARPVACRHSSAEACRSGLICAGQRMADRVGELRDPMRPGHIRDQAAEPIPPQNPDIRTQNGCLPAPGRRGLGAASGAGGGVL